MEVNAKLNEVTQKNLVTGECCFYVIPFVSCGMETDGRLLCKGRLNPYELGTPLALTGEMKNDIFEVSECRIKADTEEMIYKYLKFISNEFSEAQIKNITSLTDGDLFSFVKRQDAKDKLLYALRRSSKAERLADMLIRRSKEITGREDLFETLSGYNVPYDEIWKIITRGITEDALRKSPYTCMSIFAADRYALEECGFSKYSMQRYDGFVRAAMDYAVKDGCTCLRFPDLVDRVNYLLQGTVTAPPVLVAYCISKSAYTVKEFDGEGFVYFNKILTEEDTVLMHLKRLNAGKETNIDLSGIDPRYTQEQKNAFNLLKKGGVKILTGPPGSGKTAMIKGIIEMYHGKTKLAATTGMAADVLTGACGITDKKDAATTLHTLLKVKPFESIPEAAVKEIDAGLIIVDESSMMGLSVFSALISAVQNDAILLLVGDDNQLASIDYGNVLSDLINSGVETYRLTKVLRSDAVITDNARKILNRQSNLEITEQFKIIRCETEDEIIEYVKQTDAAVLSPIKNGVLGTVNLNNVLQKNKSLDRTRSLSYGDTTFYKGDSVVMTRNNYSAGYINGDTGVVTKINSDGITVQFKTKTLDISDIKDVDLAYAQTVHKAQGSEYESVVFVLPDDRFSTSSRRIIYTALTRAKNSICILSLHDSIDHISYRERERTSILDRRIREPKQQKIAV